MKLFRMPDGTVQTLDVVLAFHPHLLGKDRDRIAREYMASRGGSFVNGYSRADVSDEMGNSYQDCLDALQSSR